MVLFSTHAPPIAIMTVWRRELRIRVVQQCHRWLPGMNGHAPARARGGAKSLGTLEGLG
jgi:hypothetical protein